MHIEEILSRLHIEDMILYSFNINFEDHTIELVLDEPDEEISVVFQGVKTFFTNEPHTYVFPRDKIIVFRWEKLPNGDYKAQLFLDIQYSTSCLVISIVFVSIEIPNIMAAGGPTAENVRVSHLRVVYPRTIAKIFEGKDMSQKTINLGILTKGVHHN